MTITLERLAQSDGDTADSIDPVESAPHVLYGNNANYTAHDPVDGDDEVEVGPPEAPKTKQVSKLASGRGLDEKQQRSSGEVKDETGIPASKVIKEKDAVAPDPPEKVIRTAGSAAMETVKDTDEFDRRVRSTDLVSGSRNMAVTAAVQATVENTDGTDTSRAKQAPVVSVSDLPRDNAKNSDGKYPDGNIAEDPKKDKAAPAVSEAEKGPQLQTGGKGGDVTNPGDNPVPDDENDPEGNGRRSVGDNLQGLEGASLVVALSQNYDTHFSTTVPELAAEVVGADGEQHPDFLLRDPSSSDGEGAALYRVGTGDNPEDKAYAVRILSPEELGVLGAGEVERYIRLLTGPSGDNTTYGIGERIVAYDPVFQRVIVEYVKDVSTSVDPEWERIPDPVKALYMLQTLGMNMPGLHLLTAERYASPIPLPPDVEKLLIQRARDMIDIPYGQDLTLSVDERTVLRGLIEGIGDPAIAAVLGIGLSTLQKSRVAELRDRFGATNRTGLIYSAYLHGVDVGARLSAPALASIGLTPSEALQYYLVATGWEERETANMLGREYRTVHLLRSSVTRALGTNGLGINTATRQAIATGFEHGYLTPLPPEGQLAYDNDPGRAQYVHRMQAINMPDLSLPVGGPHGPREPLAVGAQREIRERARQIIETPYGRRLNLSDRETAVLQGYAFGLNQDEIADSTGLSRTTIRRLVGDLHAYFGTGDPAALMYSALFNNIDLGEATAGPTETPSLTQGEVLQFYLVATGHDADDAARLTNRDVRTVKAQLANVRRKLDSTHMPQAVAEGFRTGLLKRLPIVSS